MPILRMSKDRADQQEENDYLKELKRLLENVLKQIAVMDMDYLYELQGYVKNLIDNLEELEGDDQWKKFRGMITL